MELDGESSSGGLLEQVGRWLEGRPNAVVEPVVDMWWSLMLKAVVAWQVKVADGMVVEMGH